MKRLMLAGLAATLIACGSDDSSGPAQTVTGTYTLSTAAGKSMPATLYDVGTSKVILLSGTLTLNGNNTWTASLGARMIENGVQTDETLPASGTWVQNGSSITFTDTANGNTQFSAAVGTNKLTAQIDFDSPIGVVALVFTK